MTRPREPVDRQTAMGLLSTASPLELADAVRLLAADIRIDDLKAPEVGLVMLRGRVGADGAPFNVGEATVARAVIRLATGEIGYGLRLGRDTAAARHAAILDALLQRPAMWAHLAILLEAVAARRDRERATASAQAAATRVDFFTLSRGSE